MFLLPQLWHRCPPGLLCGVTMFLAEDFIVPPIAIFISDIHFLPSFHCFVVFVISPHSFSSSVNLLICDSLKPVLFASSLKCICVGIVSSIRKICIILLIALRTILCDGDSIVFAKSSSSYILSISSWWIISSLRCSSSSR